MKQTTLIDRIYYEIQRCNTEIEGANEMARMAIAKGSLGPILDGDLKMATLWLMDWTLTREDWLKKLAIELDNNVVAA